MSKTGGGRGTDQHVIEGGGTMRQRAQIRASAPEVALAGPAEVRAVPVGRIRLLDERSCDLAAFRPKGVDRAVSRYVQRRAEFAFSAAYLEGNSFTLPEVYALLDGKIPDGKMTDDVDQILALTEASEHLIDRVTSGDFALGLDTSDEINRILARHEAIEPGIRRSRSNINPDGSGATVNVMGDRFRGLGKTDLAVAEQDLVDTISTIEHPVLRAVNYAAVASYLQIYFDGNKRTSRYMMDGELMRHGYEAIAIPAKREPEYQEALRALFLEADASQYAAFLLDVARRSDPVA